MESHRSTCPKAWLVAWLFAAVPAAMGLCAPAGQDDPDERWRVASELAAQSRASLLEAIHKALDRVDGTVVSADFALDGDRPVIEVAIVPASRAKGLVVVTVDGTSGDVIALREPGGNVPLWVSPPRLPQPMWESFEGDNLWEPARWSGAAAVDLSSVQASHGRRALRVQFDPVDRRKVILVRKTTLNLARDRWLAIDAHADGPVKLSVAFTVGRSRIHYEPPAVTLVPRWNKDIHFDLNANNFKTAARKWAHSGRLGLRRIVREVLIVLEHVPNGAKTVYLDHIRFVRDPAEEFDDSLPIVVELVERPARPAPEVP